MKSYEAIDDLAAILLENSYILAVFVEAGVVKISADLVLLPDHPEYEVQEPSTTQCFRRGRILFECPRVVSWTMPTVEPATDATGETDWGGVDGFEVSDGGYKLSGDFGSLVVIGGACRVVLDSPSCL